MTIKKIQSIIDNLCIIENISGKIELPIKSNHKTIEEQISYYDSIIEGISIPYNFSINNDILSNGKLSISFKLFSKDINVIAQNEFNLINQ